VKKKNKNIHFLSIKILPPLVEPNNTNKEDSNAEQSVYGNDNHNERLILNSSIFCFFSIDEIN